ncbi:hypothetical protein GFK82_00370 [Candidatus Steffania adelgidicola]|nr:hypothetical protein GFK82_00370 [Candidatus Steffania adelgidicola]
MNGLFSFWQKFSFFQCGHIPILQELLNKDKHRSVSTVVYLKYKELQ